MLQGWKIFENFPLPSEGEGQGEGDKESIIYFYFIFTPTLILPPQGGGNEMGQSPLKRGG